MYETIFDLIPIKIVVRFFLVVLEMKSTIGQTGCLYVSSSIYVVLILKIPLCYVVYVIILKRNAQNVLNIIYFSLSFEVGVHVSYYLNAAPLVR